MSIIKNTECTIHNKYTLQLCDAAGNIKEERFAYNVANSSRYMSVCLGGDWPGYKYISDNADSKGRRAGITTLYLGSADSTEIAIPSADDEKLIAVLDAFSHALSFSRVNMPENYGDTVHFTASVTYPASPSYTGNIEEIGLGGDRGWIFSHAYISDVEGTTLPIYKTDRDILIVTVDVYFTLTLPREQAPFIKYLPVWATPIIDTLPGLAGRNVFLSGGYCPPTNGDICVAIPNTSCKTSTVTSSAAYLSINPEDGTQASRIYTDFTNHAFEPASDNIGFVHSIIIDKYAIIPLPDSDICPNYSYNDIAIGTGDGNTTRFYTPVNQVVSCKIYRNGTEDTTAYMVEADITKSPFWDKCIGVYESASDRDATYTKWHTLPEVGGFIPIAMSSQVFAGSSIQYSRFAPCNSAASPNFHSVGAAPVYYDAGGIYCDHIYMGALSADDGASQDIIIQYSNEDITDFLAYDSSWITLATVPYRAETAVYFTRTQAKYWRIKGFIKGYKTARISSTEVSWYGSSKKCGYDPCCLVLGDSTVHDFGKMGVNFTTAPANGDIITMDAVLNLPYKSPDTRIDFSYDAVIEV